MERDITEAIPSGTLLKGEVADGRSRWFYQSLHGLHVLDENFSLGRLLGLSMDEIESELHDLVRTAEAPIALLAPVDDDTEVWAAGVTYLVSKKARMEESLEADIYGRVYDAVRPELFFKAIGWRVSGPGDPIGIRHDSSLDVPEPEVALVLNADGVIVGYTICNDMSSRSIEGENPLYLPQAKMYRHSCALGPWIRMASVIADPKRLSIQASISRRNRVVWEGETSTAQLKRSFEELAEHLFRAEKYPRGAILSTGTCVVPGIDFTLTEQDTVSIRVTEIGHLFNAVITV
jgi:2-dehydro-3-deoxy-D-arabinonate dehydratase